MPRPRKPNSPPFGAPVTASGAAILTALVARPRGSWLRAGLRELDAQLCERQRTDGEDVITQQYLGGQCGIAGPTLGFRRGVGLCEPSDINCLTGLFGLTVTVGF